MTIAHAAQEPTTREQRALELFRSHGDEFREVEPDLFEVPSCSGMGTYIVNYETETCTCPDYIHHGNICKHVFAVGIYYAKTHRRVSVAGDPFVAAAAAQDHPHACTGGVIYLGYTYVSEETGDEVEAYEAIPCRRCAEEAT